MRDAEQNVRQIGFNSLTEFTRSELWQTICKEVRKRDGDKCRSKLCNNQAYAVIALADSIPVLLGKSPHALICLCEDCLVDIKQAEKEGIPLLKAVITKVTGAKWIPGRSEPSIGRWFRNQYNANQKFKRELEETLEELCLNV